MSFFCTWNIKKQCEKQIPNPSNRAWNTSSTKNYTPIPTDKSNKGHQYHKEGAKGYEKFPLHMPWCQTDFPNLIKKTCNIMSEDVISIENEEKTILCRTNKVGKLIFWAHKRWIWYLQSTTRQKFTNHKNAS